MKTQNNIKITNNVVALELFTWTVLCCAGVTFRGRGSQSIHRRRSEKTCYIYAMVCRQVGTPGEEEELF